MNHSDRFIFYRIHVEGHIRGDWFNGLDVSACPEGDTLISGLMDQAALHGVLKRISDLGLVLLSVESLPNKEGNSNE